MRSCPPHLRRNSSICCSKVFIRARVLATSLATVGFFGLRWVAQIKMVARARRWIRDVARLRLGAYPGRRGGAFRDPPGLTTIGSSRIPIEASRSMSVLSRRTFTATVTLAMLGAALHAEQARAAEGNGPVIGHVTAAEVAEHQVKVEAQIDPGGLETAYEIRLVWQLPDPTGGPPANAGERPTGGPQTQTAHIAAATINQTVSATFTGLQWGYVYYYVVVAGNSASQTRGESPYQFALHISGEFPNGEGTGPPYESEIPLWYTKLSEEESAQTLREYEAKHAVELEALHRQEAERQHELEALATSEAADLRRQREEEARSRAAAGAWLTGGVLTVGRGDTASAKLECLGTAGCRGRLRLTAKNVQGSRHAKGTADILVGASSFSIAADEERRIRISLNPAGRRLLRRAHGRFRATLTITALAPTPVTRSTGVRLERIGHQ